MSGDVESDLEDLAGLLDPLGTASVDWGFLEYELTGEIPADVAAALEMGPAPEPAQAAAAPSLPLARPRR